LSAQTRLDLARLAFAEAFQKYQQAKKELKAAAWAAEKEEV